VTSYKINVFVGQQPTPDADPLHCLARGLFFQLRNVFVRMSHAAIKQ